MAMEPKYARDRFVQERTKVVVKAVETGARVRDVAHEGEMPPTRRAECIRDNMVRATHKVRERKASQWNRGRDVTVKGSAKNRKVDRIETATNKFVGAAHTLSDLDSLITQYSAATGKERRRLRQQIRAVKHRHGHRLCALRTNWATKH